MRMQIPVLDKAGCLYSDGAVEIKIALLIRGLF